ncbi:MAG: hypothetical protein F6K41_41405 [Symploca sp. SIO3E6]|nr:hypothetical protein [Caldora sp. SIO3E6]
MHFYQKIPPELLTYYLLLITYYFKTRVNRLDEASPNWAVPMKKFHH